MKQNDKKINPNRMYEIVGTEPDSPWNTEFDHMYSVIGTIVQVVSDWRIIMVKWNKRKFPPANPGEPVTMSDLLLRPLNKKDQAKLQRIRDQFV